MEIIRSNICGSEREVCDSVRVGEKNPMNVGWNYVVKAAVRRKEDAWKEVLAASDEEAKESCMEAYKEEKRNVYTSIFDKKKVNKQFGWKMNEDVNGNRKLFRKEVSNVKGSKVEICNRVKDVNGK